MEKTIKLSDGRDFPVVGLGTFRVTTFIFVHFWFIDFVKLSFLVNRR